MRTGATSAVAIDYDLNGTENKGSTRSQIAHFLLPYHFLFAIYHHSSQLVLRFYDG
jgi:hypothetical protein